MRNKPMAAARYKLREGVSLSRDGDKCFLLSTFPLKALRFSPALASLFERLREERGAEVDELNQLRPEEPRERLARFLARLVKQGFLEEQGADFWAEPPKVSVIIPVFNRPRDLENCLASLFDLDWPAEKLEIIVVDDASTDDTPEIARRFPVTLLRAARRQGASRCRNQGAAAAGGDILCFLDSDCTAARDWLIELVSVFKDREVGAVGGSVESQTDRTRLDRYEQVKSPLLMGRVSRDSRNGDRFFYVPSCNLAVRRELFTALGGFREDMEVGEDVDFCWRLTDGGFVLEYRPSARVFHRHRNRLKAFCGRRFDYGTSEPLLQDRRRGRMKNLVVRPLALG
ncbi:MAG: mycofactocin biosynthesis glycosyltransferase MftF, partial [Thermodesulfobacteriota bacterium]